MPAASAAVRINSPSPTTDTSEVSLMVICQTLLMPDNALLSINGRTIRK